MSSLLLVRLLEIFTCGWLYQGKMWGKAPEWGLLPCIRRCSEFFYILVIVNSSRRRKEDLSVLWMQNFASCSVLPECLSGGDSEEWLRLWVGNTQENYCQHGMAKVILHFFTGTDVRCKNFYLCAHAALPWPRHIHLKVHFAYAIFKLTLHIFTAVGAISDGEDTVKPVA